MVEPDSAVPRWMDLFSTDLRVPTAVLSTGILMHSMNALLMSTVMPSAVKDIGGLAYMSWPTTGFLATSVIAASAGGLARATFGARNAYALAATLFGIGSLLAGIAPDMGWLVAGRAVQGFGGGFLSSLAYIMVRNVYPDTLWPRVFALFSSIWGVSVLIGPLLGGVFAGLGFWRGAFLVVAGIALTLTLLAVAVLPADTERPARPPFPGFRLALVGLGIVTLSLAAPSTSTTVQAMLIAAGLALFVIVLLFDRAATARLLPSDAFSLRTPVGLGLWVLFLITAANDPFPIYGPLFFQTLHDMQPLSAGYLVAMESMSWTIVAAIVATLPLRFIPWFLAAGPFTMALGLIGISMTTESGPIGLTVIAIFLAGGGIGSCFSFLSQAILRESRDGEGDSAASSVATVQLVGLASGAAIAGLFANVTGFANGLSVVTASAAASWIPAIFAAPALLAAAAAIGLNKTRLRQVQPASNSG